MAQRSLAGIAKSASEFIVKEAQSHGYVNSRAVFFRSDLMELESEILHWLINHMRPDRQ